MGVERNNFMVVVMILWKTMKDVEWNNFTVGLFFDRHHIFLSSLYCSASHDAALLPAVLPF
ncbi:hypothetical protein QJS10_CPB18g01177 [Acorus calamus]|uniref:Uncharacterized protein n=1 Tax=Acorus calamus TaxID=4465 RepID=A0AAV9CNB2_ACOCL|nr:hypothetical protein QJS10_CPB18g01177 [Acorus calamus]